MTREELRVRVMTYREGHGGHTYWEYEELVNSGEISDYSSEHMDTWRELEELLEVVENEF